MSGELLRTGPEEAERHAERARAHLESGQWAQAADAIAQVAAGGGHARALALLGSLVAAEPDQPWASADWFTPRLAESVSARAVASAVAPIFNAVGYVEDPELRSMLNPWLALMRAAAARGDAGAQELRALSAAARRLGAAADAVAWCERAVRLERKADPKSPSSLIMLGYAQRDAGAPDRAVEAWKAALKIAPGHVELHLDLADLEFQRGNPAAALRWAARAVDLDGGSVKARGCLMAARARVAVRDAKLDDAVALSELIALVTAHPQTTYLRALLAKACEGVWWVQTVPAPREAAASASAVTPAPAAPAIAVLRKVSDGTWPHPLAAFERSAPLGALDAGDLLGLLAEDPAAGAWVCLGILHHRAEQPWPESERRSMLLELLRGPDEWTASAAAFALCVQAWLVPQQRSEIARELTARHRSAAGYEPFAALVLICPAIAPDVRAEARAHLGIAPRERAEGTAARRWLGHLAGRHL